MKKPSALDQKLADLTSDLQRTRADFENFRKHSDLQKEQYATVVKITTVKKLLPLLDDISRAISIHPELAPLNKTLDKAMSDLSLSEIPSAPETPFDPELHEAISVDGEGEAEKISETLRPGYLYEGTLLRPALVKVQKS